ncbi:MAG: cystathionine beta-synthase [Deltaproteobacteria bacterium]|nr:cystathionine beta-synthase [Deltaproteobacteria bacterium]
MSNSPSNLISLIGNTPMVEIKQFDAGKCRLFVKLENQNPGGSIKDRIALSMIQAAEKSGALRPGGTLVEATAGNTGLALALVAVLKGYKLILVIPDKMSREKINHLRAMGAQIVMTRSDVGKGHPEYYQDLAQKIAEDTPGSYYVNQFANPANVYGHRTTTAPEIWQQLDGKVDAVVAGVGSGGTISGLSQYFAETAPHVEIVLADPEGSILAEYVDTGKLSTETGSWLVEGIGEDFLPPIADLSRVKIAYTISDKESFVTARELLKKEGIFGGSSSGTLVAAALRYCRDQSKAKNVVTFICDSGNKYLSKMYNDYWMLDQGFIEREQHGDLRDLITRLHQEGATVTIGRSDTLLTAYARMKLYDISQLPVVEGAKIVGIIDESDLLLSISKDQEGFKKSLVGDVMTNRLETVTPDVKVDQLIPIFEKGHVVLVERKGEFLGLITRIDLLNYLRRRMAAG